jgi:hypothetical protein
LERKLKKFKFPIKAIFTLTIITMIFFGCGKKGDYIPTGETTLDFKTSFAALASDVFQGGIMVYAISETGFGTRGAEFFDSENLNNPDGPLRSLPNGNWKFFALGFENSGTGVTSSDPLGSSQDSISCGSANGGSAVTLTGGTQTISFIMSRSNCANSQFFAPTDLVNTSISRVNQMRIHTCSSSNFGSIDTSSSTTPSSSVTNCGSDSYSGKILVFGFPQYNLANYLFFNQNQLNLDLKTRLSTSVIGCKENPGSVINLGHLPLGNITGPIALTSPFLFVVSLMTGSCSDIAAATELQTAVMGRGPHETLEGGDNTSIISKIYSFNSGSNHFDLFFNTGQ